MKNPWNWFRSGRKRDPVDIGLPELERAVASVEPAARLVLPRLLRRVIRRHTSLPGMGLHVPHDKTYVIPRTALLEIADRDELGFGPTEDPPEHVILLERPSGELLEQRSRDEILLYYWQLLFHARVHAEFQRLAEQQRFGAAEAEKRLAALGSRAVDEIRNVLGQERFLLPPGDDPSLYVEFAAVYLGMRCFQPCLLASFFPALESLEEVDEVISADLRAETILAATRLPGTPLPEELPGTMYPSSWSVAEKLDTDRPGVVSDPDERAVGRGRTPVPSRQQVEHWGRGRRRSEEKYLRWSQRAERQAARGNLAGAAIRRARAEYWAPRERAAEAATALRHDVHGLVERLQTALGIEGQEPRPWREALLALAHQAPRGLWTIEARLLYDLQKVCVDQGRTISTVDVMQWVLSWGRRPIRRELPNQRLVLVARHLRSAQRRLPAARISERQQRQLAEVLDVATKTAEARLRENFRPKLVAALDEVGLAPQNLVEVVSRKKLVEELLDRIVEGGFLTLGEVRDAVSRNHLKEPDCAGGHHVPMVVDFFRGDAVLRLNGQLTLALDGVYERGDFYQRWIQRFSMLAFGTIPGRCLTKYLAIPFGGAVVVLIVVEHLASMVTGREEFYAPTWNEWRSFGPTLLTGIFLFLLIHVRWFRSTLWELLVLAGRALRLVCFDSFRGFFGLPLVRWMLKSPLVRFLGRYLLKPLLPTLLVWLVLPRNQASWATMIDLAATFVLLSLLINSRFGRHAEEALIDWSVEGWRRFGTRVLLGLFWWLVDLFRHLMQWIERLMYTVDEWLRFKSGEGRGTMVLKGAMGVVWFFAAYAIRFCVRLLVEPQLNPVKHVPWVTVSHKIMAPIWIAMDLRGSLAHHMSQAMADVMTFLIVTLTPGIFGFLVWELKENWRLFAANRSKTLDPVLVGSHGESLPRLLRPGLHSGTVPKRFARLRRAERKAVGLGSPRREGRLAGGGDLRLVRKHRELLHHVETDLRRYVRREFVAWFAESRSWGYPLPQVQDIHLATNAMTVELTLPHPEVPGTPGSGPLLMIFELVRGKLQLDLSGRICGDDLPAAARHVLRTAIVNLLKTGGIERFRCTGSGAADGGGQLQEIASLAVPWSEWVATWETGCDLPAEAWGSLFQVLARP